MTASRRLVPAILCLVLAGCAARTPATATASLQAPPTPGLLVEPTAGLGEIYSLLGSARHSLDMTMYELVDSRAEAILAADAGRGVAVRVVLDGALERRENQAAYAYLQAHRVAVRWGPAGFHATHEKAFVVDRAAAVIMTLNLTSRYYSDTRDFAVVDRDPGDVDAVEAVFAGDFAGAPVSRAPTGADLLWSPGAAPTLVSLVDSARSSIILESEELSDSAVVSALVDAARRGVDVRVVMTYSSDYRENFERLAQAGAHVATYAASAPLYIHAKAMVVDDRVAFVGSENLSADSLDHDRELGLVTTAPPVVSGLEQTMSSDWRGAQPFPAGG